jgi:predicted SAM-dependent methyltransferase
MDRTQSVPAPAASEATVCRQLDVGCGSHRTPGFIGMDRIPLPNVDVVFDFDSGQRWPFEDDTFDFIRAIHVIEHVNDPLYFFGEIHRVGRPGCMLHFETPHFSSNNSWSDPTHVRHYSSTFLDVMAEGYLAYPVPKFEVTARSISFSGLLPTWPGWLISRVSLKKYERYYAWMFPASSITVRAKVLK